MTETQWGVVLQRISSEGKTDQYEVVAAETRLGRSAVCDFQIKDPLVSRLHARLLLRQGEYYIQDLNSANGTWVNGVRVTRVKLQPGDHIQVGSNELVFQLAAAEDPTHLVEQALNADEPDTGEYEMPAFQMGGYCPNCENPYPRGAKFCLECGKELEPPTLRLVCAACGTRYPQEAKYCMECGRPRPGAAYERLPGTAPFTGPPPPRHRPRPEDRPAPEDQTPPEDLTPPVNQSTPVDVSPVEAQPERPAWPVEQIIPTQRLDLEDGPASNPTLDVETDSQGHPTSMDGPGAAGRDAAVPGARRKFWNLPLTVWGAICLGLLGLLLLALILRVALPYLFGG